MKPLIPYMRKSSKEDPRVSRERQERVIAAWANQHGEDLGRTFWEPGVSGSRHWRERQLGEAIAACERGEASGIVVEEQSRLSRENGLATAEVWEALQSGGFRLVCVNDGIDTANGDQELNFALRAAMAREQWKQYARRIEHAKQNAIARGVHIAGTVPVGYLRPGKGEPLILDPRKWKVIRDAFRLRATGATLSAVAALLDKRLPGGPSGSGVWNRNTVARLLANRVYLGEATDGRHVNPAAHAPIIDLETFDTCQALSTRSEVASTSAQNLLAGIAVCGGCGYALDRNRVNGDYFHYRCRGRSAAGVCEARASASAPAVDAIVEAAVLEHLGRERIERSASVTDVADIHNRLAAARVKRSMYEDADLIARLGAEATIRNLATIDDEIAAVEQELADAIGHEVPPIVVEDVESVWPTLTLSERREVIASMVEGVVISRASGVALVDRINIVWKGESLPVARPSRGRPKGTEVEAGLAAA